MILHYNWDLPMGLVQDDGQGMYFDLSTAFEVFLIFTSQIYSLFLHLECVCRGNDKKGVLLHKYSQPVRCFLFLLPKYIHYFCT